MWSINQTIPKKECEKMYNFRIKSIETKDKTIINPKKINIIIGPNNSGKSQFLKDIRNILSGNNNSNCQNLIIKKMKYVLPNNKEEFIERYRINSRVFKHADNQWLIRNYSGITNNGIEMNNSINAYLDNGNISIIEDWMNELEREIRDINHVISRDDKIILDGNYPSDAVVHHKSYVEYTKNGEIIRDSIGETSGPFYEQNIDSENVFINNYGRLFFNYLGTEEKLLMCKKQKKYGIQDYNTNFLSEVQFNLKLIDELSRYTKEMFNKDIYLDRYSWGENLLFRVGDDFDFIRQSSRNDNEKEIKLSEYNMLDNEGDGLKSFVTNYLALHMNDKNILLLDEPESFLHPPLAKQLGEIIANSACDNKQIFLSTHSVDLLKGILNINSDVNIIRITRDNDINHFNILDKEKLEEIIMNPMLASSNVLNGLFCEKVFICEAESDEQFYQYLHDRVNQYDSAFFTHGKNKQTLKDIAKSYNELGIQNYRIYDFDILKDEDFNKALNAFIDDKQKINL